MYVDSHAHISSESFLEDYSEIISRANEAKVNTIINICTDRETYKQGQILAENFSGIYNVFGTTPHDVDRLGEQDFPLAKELAQEKSIVALGESGLDYYYEHSSKDKQKEYLVKYLHLALESELPIVIHCREAFADFFEIIDREYTLDGKVSKGVLHCFTGTLKEAEMVLDRGWYLSLSGIVSFKKSHTLHEVAKMVPLNQMLIETDSPYLAPVPKRGKRNEPSFLPHTAAFISGIKNISVDELAKATSKNAQEFFNLDPLP
jgi:TatD DNase family protein